MGFSDCLSFVWKPDIGDDPLVLWVGPRRDSLKLVVQVIPQGVLASSGGPLDIIQGVLDPSVLMDTATDFSADLLQDNTGG